MQDPNTVLLHFHLDEVPYLPYLKSVISGRVPVKLDTQPAIGFYDVVMRAKAKGARRVATTSPKLLSYLLATTPAKLKHFETTGDYAGSIFEKAGVEFLILPPLEHLITVPYGKFIASRYWQKFTDPASFLQLPDFSWEVFQPSRKQALLDLFSESTFISIDIETVRDDEDRSISCCGFTSVRVDAKTRQVSAHTVVVPFEDMYNVCFAREISALPAPKVLQRGKYDIVYLLRYRVFVYNWAFDTLSLFHSWYSELPKDLAFIIAFCLRRWIYHKDEARVATNSYEYFEYNAKDCYTTAMCLLVLLSEMPQWAIENEKMKFPLHFPCVLAELTGIKCDQEEMKRQKQQLLEWGSKRLTQLQTMVGNKLFNPRSSQQTVRLFEVLGSGHIKSSAKASLDKVKAAHPLNKRILGDIEKYRADMKLGSTYTDLDKLWHGRIFYELNPAGTDTGRNASSESNFWCGYQIQNIPRDRKDIQVKRSYIADSGFYLGEADGEQAEARDTAYLSGDLKLIETVEGDRDYHGVNAERFFGIPYEAIVAPDGTVLNKDIRDLSKRTNHGSNYNMGAGVLLDTMGIENVLKARRILRLPDGRSLEQAKFSLKLTCQFMLNCYEAAYPTVKKDWYDKCTRDVKTTGMLVGATGWSRYCFGNPDVKNGGKKRDLNRYVAHPPQSLNAMVLNRAFVRVFFEVWLENSEDFKLLAQIHDSILFQYRIGRRDLAYAVKRCMEITIPVKDSFGIERNLLVPVALKGESAIWSDLIDEKKWTPRCQPTEVLTNSQKTSLIRSPEVV